MPKCSECIYLAVRNFQTGETVEAIEDTRKSGIGIDNAAAQFSCSLGHDAFQRPPIPRPQEDIVWQTHDCSRIKPHVPGRSPKDQFQMDLLSIAEAREDERDRKQRRSNLMELAIVGFVVPAVMIAAQFMATQMQVKATMEATLLAHKLAGQPTAVAPKQNQPQSPAQESVEK